MMMTIMMMKCNKFDRWPGCNVLYNFGSIVHSPAFICAPRSCNKARRICFLIFKHICQKNSSIFSYLFVSGNFPVSELFRRSSFQTFMIEKGVYLLVDWFYNRRRGTIDHLDIYKHIYHGVVVFSISVKYCLRVRRVFHFITWTAQTRKHFKNFTQSSKMP